MDKIKVMAVLDDEVFKAEIKRKLTQEDIAFVGFARLLEKVTDKVRGILPDVVVIAGENEEEALRCAREIYISLQGCSILFLRAHIELEFVEKAMQAGARKVLQMDCEPRLLMENIQRCFALERAKAKNSGLQIMRNSSKVITVFGSKGGIGKSTIASNLAVSLMRKGKKVAVLDLDLQFGDINLFFDVDPKDTIGDLAQAKQSLDVETIQSYMVEHTTGIHILCAPKSPEIAETIQGRFVEKIINTIRPYFDYIVIDTLPYFDDISITCIEQADMILQIITLDISALRNARISLDIFHSLLQKEKVHVLVNRYSSGIISIKDAQGILDYPVNYKIPCDWKTATASLNRGIPIILDAPRSPIGRELINLGAAILRDTAAKQQVAAKK